MLSEEPHMRACAFENTNKKPNTLAICSQEPPKKIEFTLKAATATEPLEVLSQLFWSANLIIQHFMHYVHALSKERSIIEGCFSSVCVCVWSGVINSNYTCSRISFCTSALFFWFWAGYLEKSIVCSDVMIRWGKKSACWAKNDLCDTSISADPPLIANIHD